MVVLNKEIDMVVLNKIQRLRFTYKAKRQSHTSYEHFGPGKSACM